MKTSSRPDDAHSLPAGFDGLFLTRLRLIQAAIVTYPDSAWLRDLLPRHGQGSLTAR
jgi:hypothetical protein